MASDTKPPAVVAGGAVRATKQPEQKASEPERKAADESPAVEAEEARILAQLEAEERLAADRRELERERACFEVEKREAYAAFERATKAGAATPHVGKYVIAAGECCMTARGPKLPGQEVTADDLSGGQKTLDERVTKGRVLRS